MRIAFIGFGEAARAFADSLGPAAGAGFTAYDVLWHGPDRAALEQAAAARGVVLAPAPAAATEGAEIVISAVTAAESLEALRPLAGRLGPGQVLIDITSVSAPRKAETAALVRAGGAAYVDMAVMGPVHPDGHRTPVLVAGDLAPDFLALLAAWGFRFEVAGPEPGDAAAVKMVRSLFVKGLEALTVQTLAAAAASGATDRVLASLAASYPGLGWPGFAAYAVERVATHGLRRAAEMREVAATLAALGLAEGVALARAVAGVQAAAARARPATGPDLGATAAGLAAALTGAGFRPADIADCAENG